MSDYRSYWIGSFLFFALSCLPLVGGPWRSLFDGKTMDGWTNQGDANWSVVDATLTVDHGKAGLLTWKETLANYELELEFKADPETNSGVFLHTVANPKDPGVDCYEINIAPPSNPFPTGSIVKRKKVEVAAAGDVWHQFRFIIDNDLVTVLLNGQKIISQRMKNPRPAGLIGLQKNSGKVAFRNIRLRELSSPRTKE